MLHGDHLDRSTAAAAVDWRNLPHGEAFPSVAPIDSWPRPVECGVSFYDWEPGTAWAVVLGSAHLARSANSAQNRSMLTYTYEPTD
jgi:hypothetical protein